jgi:hypothetical protein
VANATLTKYRFDPVKLAALLANYRSVQQSVLGDRNPHEYLFFELKRDATVVPVSAEGLSTRMARITGRLFGQTLGATMFRCDPGLRPAYAYKNRKTAPTGAEKRFSFRHGATTRALRGV